MSPAGLRRVVGLGAVIVPALHTLSDILELLGGGFSPVQLSVSYLSFLATPFVVIGLHAMQQSRGGWLSLSGAVSYGAAYVFFAGTALYALVRRTRDYATMVEELGALYAMHGVLMVVGGLLFGVAVARAGVLPRWTGTLLVIGVTLNLVFGIWPLPDIAEIGASMARNIAFLGMGVACARGADEVNR